jgi:hypothetical protein
MNRFVNWKSIEKDGLPKQEGQYLVYIKNQNRITCDYFDQNRWIFYTDVTGNYDRITHYILMQEIPHPK